MDSIFIAAASREPADSLARFFEERGGEVCASDNGADALERLGSGSFDLVLLEDQMPGLSGLETLRRLRTAGVRSPVIVFTAAGSMETAIEAMKHGAYDYLLCPFDPEELQRIAHDAIQVSRMMKRPAASRPHPGPGLARRSGRPRMVGSSRKMQEVFKLIGQVAEKDVTVLVTGESGTGKELVAQALYHHSARKDRPFLAVNCAAIPDPLFESELFGHERGAFTGADRARLGKFERAAGGTLFFDEIGDMSRSTQAKVLRALQEGEFERLGGGRTIKCDVRIIAATNQDLEKEVAAGRFREDLYWRLKIISIHLPPLAERMEDLPELARYFLDRFAAEYEKEIPGLDDEALHKLCGHDWPGNVRELENCLRRAALLCAGGVVRKEHIRIGPDREGASPAAGRGDVMEDLKRRIEDLVPEVLSVSGGLARANMIELVEEIIIARALELCGHNQVQAARMLGISRNTLRHRVQKYRLGRPGPKSGI